MSSAAPLPLASTSVAIVIPCYNAEATLGAAIESALSQPDVGTEILVVDDGSTDRSCAVAAAFGARIRLLTGPNRGVSAARNRGIAESTGEWIVFLDADDLLLSGTLVTRLQFADGADVIACDWREFSGDGPADALGAIKSIDIDALQANAEASCATHVWATTAALMYRRRLVEAIGGFREDLPVIEDARFLFDAAFHGARFARSPHIGAFYRMRPESLSRADPARFWRCVLYNIRQIDVLWRGRGPLDRQQRAALATVYNAAAHNLFRIGDPLFREALAELRAAGLSVNWRNQVKEAASNMLGQRHAALANAVLLGLRGRR